MFLHTPWIGAILDLTCNQLILQPWNQQLVLLRIFVLPLQQFCIAFTFFQQCSSYSNRFCVDFFAFYLHFSIFALVFLPHLQIRNFNLLYSDKCFMFYVLFSSLNSDLVQYNISLQHYVSYVNLTISLTHFIVNIQTYI